MILARRSSCTAGSPIIACARLLINLHFLVKNVHSNSTPGQEETKQEAAGASTNNEGEWIGFRHLRKYLSSQEMSERDSDVLPWNLVWMFLDALSDESFQPNSRIT